MLDIKLRNFIILFLSFSLLIFINHQINQKKQQRQHIQQLVKNIFKNQTDQQLNRIVQSHLPQKLKLNMPAAHCLARLYLNVLEYIPMSKELSQKVINLHQNKDFQDIKTCGDIISLIHYQYPKQTQITYASYLNQKYGQFDQKITTKYCVLVNQFNNSLTTLKKSINSVLNQDYQNFKLIIIDNDSGDGSYQISKVFLQEWKQQQVQNGKESFKMEDLNKKYKLIKSKKHLTELNLLNNYLTQCGDAEYIILLDGRDQFLGEYTFQLMNDLHKKYELITSSVLSSQSFSKISEINAQHPYHFKAFSKQLFNKVNEQIQAMNIQNTQNQKEISNLITQKMLKIAGQNQTSGIAKIDQILMVYHEIGPGRNRYQISKSKSSKKQKQNKQKVEISSNLNKSNQSSTKN